MISGAALKFAIAFAAMYVNFGLWHRSGREEPDEV
jgi:hypothetical protein